MSVDKDESVQTLIPLYFIKLAGKQFRGRTRLQKLVFLAQQSLNNLVDYQFRPAQLGPLSYNLYKTMESLKSLNLVKETIRETPYGNTAICYELTREGNLFLDFAIAKQASFSHAAITLDQIHRKYGNMSITRLLKEVHEDYPAYVL